MARPRRDAGTPDACQRIADAFWELLDEHQLSDITVGTIAAKAAVNRGTFYYHFVDINDMIDKIIKNEMFGNNIIPNTIFNMVTGVDQDYIDNESYKEFFVKYVGKMRLLFDKGGDVLISSKIKALLVEKWAAILLTNEEEMKVTSRVIIEYASSGALGIIAYAVQQDEPKKVMIETQAFRSALSDFVVNQLAHEEGLTKDEILSRILMIGRFSKATKK